VSELISKVGVSSREEVAGYWRQERAPRRRLTRTLRGLVAGPALKLAGGGAAVGIAATGVVWVAMAANTGGGSPLAVSVTATPTQATLPATPAPAAQGSLSSNRPAGCPTSARAELTMFNSSFAGVSVVGANLAYSGFGAFAVVFDDAQRTRRPDAAPPDLLKDDRRVGFEVCHQQSLTSTGCNH
jgi:hypothetical protein